VTASRLGDLTAKTKTGYSASRANYMAQLICERMTGMPQSSFSNAAMEWGTAQEPIARAHFEARMGVFVKEVGFMPHPTIENAGASPDGLLDDDESIVEFKCPNTATHIETLLGQEIDKKYVMQMQWQLACTGRKKAYFCSFDPRLPEHLQLFVKEVERDDSLIAELEEEVRNFLTELEEKCNKLKGIQNAH
jgi:putative phage-type endonuclease